MFAANAEQSGSAEPHASFLRRPPLWFAVVVAVLAVAGMALLRLWHFPDKVLPIGYGVPLLLFVWLRRRALLWLTVAAFTAISVLKFFWVLPEGAPDVASPGMRVADFVMIEVDLLVIAAVMHALIDLRERMELRNVELRQNNQQLASLNRALAVREEEVGRQNEALQGQTAALARQTEEMRVANDELTRRERVTETLLSLSRGLTTELTRDEMVRRICDVLGQLLHGRGTGAAILEQDGGVLRVACHVGFGAAGPAQLVLPLERAFAGQVLSRGRTASVDDLRERPELLAPQPAAGEPFAAVLAAPLRAMGWPVGTLEVYRQAPGPGAAEQVALVESLAAQASISLEALRHLEQVSQERRRYETVLRTVPVGIIVCNADCTDVRMNPAGGAMLSLPPDVNVANDPGFESLTVRADGQHLPREEWPLTRAARHGQDVYGGELEVITPQGRRLFLLTNARPVRDAAGRPAGGVAAFVDITAQKELQRELDTRRREAEEASVRKTRFLAAVSHDIRTPANAITLLAELIRRTASNPALASEVPELAQELHASALSLVELLGDVLDLARYDSGRLEMQETEFALAELLDEEHRRFVPLAREKGLSLTLALPEAPLRIRADRIKLSRVIGNLVGNAIKFTAAGAVSIEAGRDGARGAAVVRVRDTGIGIPPQHQEHIFDEFVQLHNRERDRNKGTGLGLTICKRLVDAMGGALTLESEPGRGSTFTVTLPPAAVVA